MNNKLFQIVSFHQFNMSHSVQLHAFTINYHNDFWLRGDGAKRYALFGNNF